MNNLFSREVHHPICTESARQPTSEEPVNQRVVSVVSETTTLTRQFFRGDDYPGEGPHTVAVLFFEFLSQFVTDHFRIERRLFSSASPPFRDWMYKHAS
ncbi:hypothetical protein [Pseudomonas phage vB_PaeP_PS28]|nr:hypothetical protein [Pseudomonas phage vB_PaeP_PS28]